MRIGEENPETLFHYSATDTAEFETQVTHPDGGVATYRYDALWRLLAFENEAGETQTFTWTAMKLASRTNAAGLTTSWSYEIEKDVIPGYVNSPIPVRERVTETQPSGNVVVSLYDRHAMHLGAVGAWPLLSREDSLGLLETRSYDDAGRVSLIDNGAGESISVGGYPERGLDHPGGVFADTICRSHDSSCALGSPLYGYDKQWREYFPRVGGILILGAFWQYDEVGNLLKGGGTATPTSAGRPGIASRGFNADRELTSIEYWSQETYDSEQLSIERRSDGQPTRITRPYGGDTEFDYDTLGRIVSRRERVDGAWQASHWEYDGRDRVTAVEKPNGMRTETRYDGVGRITEIKHRRDGVMEKVVWLTWSNGRVAVRFDSTQGANESFAYNGAGRVSSILYPAGESLEFDYDLRGRVTEKALPPGGRGAAAHPGHRLRCCGADSGAARRRQSTGGVDLHERAYRHRFKCDGGMAPGRRLAEPNYVWEWGIAQLRGRALGSPHELPLVVGQRARRVDRRTPDGHAKRLCVREQHSRRLHAGYGNPTPHWALGRLRGGALRVYSRYTLGGLVRPVAGRAYRGGAGRGFRGIRWV